jgi:hypothetical protein
MDAFLRVFFESAEARRILGAPELEPAGNIHDQTATIGPLSGSNA